MRTVLVIAAREVLEQTRQRGMVGTVATLYGAIGGMIAFILVQLDHIAKDPERVALLARNLETAGVRGGMSVEAIAGSGVAAFNFLTFMQVLGIAGMLAGHGVLHDRQCGTLPFLLLAPVRRAQLLAGKVLGAVALPLSLSLLGNGLVGAVIGRLDVAAPYADRLPPAPGWLAAFLLGGPAWTLFVATLCAIVSSWARDVRTAQQGVVFVVTGSTVVCGVLLNGLVPQGAAVQVAVAAVGLAGAIAALYVGSQLMSRDVAR
ncbi:MAG: ABC transporter permease subunit [Myxococcota bacterium]